MAEITTEMALQRLKSLYPHGEITSSVDGNSSTIHIKYSNHDFFSDKKSVVHRDHRRSYRRKQARSDPACVQICLEGS